MTSVHSNCLICNSQNIEKLERYRINYLAKCRSCGFVFCEKIPAENELLSYYTNYPRNNFNSEITVKRYNELLDEFEKYRNTENILDIGSGDGYFLNEAQKRGWNVFGTEYTNTAISICSDKGITMHKGKLSPENYREYFFDIITSFEVIEHINYPQSEMYSIRKILRPGGLFYFTTPNFNSLSRIILKEKCEAIIGYPEHLSYFTTKTIKKILYSSGLNIIKLQTTGIDFSYFRKKKIVYTSIEIPEEKGIENLREKSEKNSFYKYLKRIINFKLNLFKAGDTIKIWAIKPID